jgi:membrane-associated phospholipid phosphatase
MGLAVGLCYFVAESYGRAHYSLAISNAGLVRALGNFSLPHVFGEQAIYWGSEFVVLPLVAVVLFVMNRDDVLWNEWTAFCATSVVGSLVFVAFPVAPPWAASGNIIALGDPFGAMPSLHIADAVIVAVCLGRIARRNWGYVAGWVYVAAVSYSVISTRNHYPADVIAGGILGALAMWRRVPYAEMATV